MELSETPKEIPSDDSAPQEDSSKFMFPAERVYNRRNQLGAWRRYETHTVTVGANGYGIRVRPVVFFDGGGADVPARVTQPVNTENVVTLRGNTHPLARPEYDQGIAPDSLPTERILLVLKRSAEQETALRQLLDGQQIKSSPNYHMWLTPEQFGQQFGPADADIQAVTDWLTFQGFQVGHVAAGRTVIEFSGTAGQVRQAFHTEIHKYVVNGEEHWANASDPQIPAALTPVVAGFASLNNFPRGPMYRRPRRLFPIKRDRQGDATLQLSRLLVVPLVLPWPRPDGFCHYLQCSPLWSAGTDGTGQTIAVSRAVGHQPPGRDGFPHHVRLAHHRNLLADHL